MTTTLSITNLLYEEIIMLQDIMMMVENMDFASNLDETEREIFNDLYDKIINS
jgi:hypothetical protein